MDNQNDQIQLCHKLGAIVQRVLSSSRELLYILEEVIELYKPKTREEADKFNCLRFDLPDSVGLLCDLRKIDMPDDDEFYDAVAPLKNMALDVAARMVGANILTGDIINMYVEPHDDDTFILLYLTILHPVSNSIFYLHDELSKLLNEKSLQWPDLLVLDDDTVEKDNLVLVEEEDIVEDEDVGEDEESVLPGEVDSFQLMRSILINTLKEYSKDHESQRISNFIQAIQDYLENFAKGIEPDKEFDFDFVLRTDIGDNHDMEYMGFHFESEMIQISSGGSVYDKAIGSDSYTNWDYNIWLNGWDEDNHDYRFDTMLYLVLSGAKLSIESPDEFADDAEDEQ